MLARLLKQELFFCCCFVVVVVVVVFKAGSLPFSALYSFIQHGSCLSTVLDNGSSAQDTEMFLVLQFSRGDIQYTSQQVNKS